MPKPSRRLIVAASIAAVVGRPISVWAQDSAPKESPVTQPPAGQPPATPTGPKDGIQFNFKDAPVDQVLDVFARESGVPVIFEAPIPQGTVTFVSSARYSFEDALSIFNLNLARMGVYLRRQDKYLYMATLADSMKRPLAVPADAASIAKLTPDQIITVSIPLDNARVEQVAEQVKALISPLGGVLPIPTQNMLVLVESAAQVKRIREIVTAIDSRKPADAAFKLFPMKHAQAETVLTALKGLVGERQKTVIVDKDGSQRVVQDTQVQGLSLVADPRTNSIIAVGPESRLRTCEEVIGLLDVPGGETVDNQLATFVLSTVTAEAAAQRLTAMFASVDAKARPVVLPLPEVSKVTVVGAPEHIGRAAAVIAEMDPAAGRSDGSAPGAPARAERRAVSVRLKHLPASTVEGLASRLLTPRQVQSVKFAASPDGKSLIIAGPDADVKAFQEMIAGLDTQDAEERDVRLVKIAGDSPEAVIRKVQGLYEQTGKGRTDPVTATVDPDSRTATLVGTRAGLTAFSQLLTQTDANAVSQEVRRFDLTKTMPSALIPRLARLSRPLLTPTDGTPYSEPVFEAIDESRTLIVRARPSQFETLTGVVRQLDAEDVTQRQLRMVELRQAKAADVVAVMADLVKSSQTLRGASGPEPAFEAIDATNTVIVAAKPDQIALIEALVRDLDTRQGTERPPMRLFRLKATDAANVAGMLQRNFDGRPPEQRTKQPVVIDADAATNTLIVSAHPDALPEIERIITELNDAQAADSQGREIRIFPLKVARAEELAQTIDQMFPDPPAPLDPRTRQPRPDLKPAREVVVRADRATNSLIVDAPAKRLAGFEQLVRSLDQQKLGENVSLRTYHVERADLNSVAQTIRSLAAGGSLTSKISNAPLTVSVEPVSRTLVVSGPGDVFDGVEDVLKRLDTPPALPPSEMKLYSLASARAERVQPVIERVLSQRLREMKTPDGKAYPTTERLIDVSADQPSNTLIVSAPREVIVIADGLVKALDQQSVATATEVRVFRLSKGEAATVATAVANAVKAQDKPGTTAATITPEPASNTIVIVGTSEQIERAGKLIESMDQAVSREGLGVKTIPLRHARAESLAPVLEGVLARESAIDRMPDWMRVQVLARGGPETPKVKVAAEPRLNAIVVSGPKSIIDVAEQVVAELDVDAAGSAGARAVRVISLQNADAAQLAQSIDAVFKDAASQEPAPVVRVDAASNSLIVRAGDAQLATIEELTKKLDGAAAGTARQMRMVPIDRSRADAELMAQTLRRLLEQQGGAKVEVISADELLKRGKEPPPPEPAKKTGSTMPWPVRAAVLGAVALRPEPEAPKAEPEPAPSPAQPAGDEGGVTIAVDRATNTLMIVGSPRMADRLAALAAQLQTQMPAEPAGVRLVTLPSSVDPTTLAQTINQTVAQIGRMSAANPGGFTGAVTVTPDPSGSSLVVLANETDFKTVGELIGTLSQLGVTPKVSVKVYPLTNTTAPRALAALRDLFTPSPAGQQARRVRQWEIEMRGPDGVVSGKIDPSQLRITTDPGQSSIIIAAPSDAIPVIDRLVETVDQSPVSDRLSIRRYEVRNARAQDLAQTLQSLFDAQRQGPAAWELPSARFVAEARTNTLLVTASEPQHRDVQRLLEQADAKLEAGEGEVAMIPLRQASPSAVQKIIDEVVVGRDPAKRDKVRVSAQDGSSLLVVRAPKEELEQIRGIIAQVDAAETFGSVRSIKLERADAAAVASALQKFFADRATLSAKPGVRATSRVAVIGDKRSSTLVVSASDEDFAQVQDLVKTFDSPAPSQDFQFKVVQLRNARANEVTQTIKSVLDELRWESIVPYWSSQQGGGQEHKVYVEGNDRTNSIVLVGQGEALATAEKVIQSLDIPDTEKTAMTIKAVKVKAADLRALQSALRQAFTTPGWRSWRGPDPEAVTVEIDSSQRALILVGKAERVTDAARYIADLDQGDAAGARKIESLTLNHAKADRTAQALRQFFAERSRAQGVDQAAVTVMGTTDGNTLIVSADEDNLKIVRDLVSQIDQPEGGKDRRIEVVVLKNGVANDVAASLRAMFSRDSKGDERIIITPQAATNSIIISAPQAVFADVSALLAQLDAAPRAEETNIETIALTTARAQEVATALRNALPPNVKVTVTPVARSNSLMLTGSKEAIAIAMEQVRKIDKEPVRSGLVFRRFKLTAAEATDVSYTVSQMLRARPRNANDADASIDYSRPDNTVTVYAPADQIEEIEKIIRELDQAPTEERTTEFVKLDFANATQAAEALKVFYGRYAPEAAGPAARNVTILPDKLSNSLVIRADKTQWEGIRALLTKLDTKEYDTTRQLAVIALEHADAVSVARALNEGLRAPLDEQVRRAQARPGNQGPGQRPGDNRPEATVLVDAEGVPTVSAEPQTNSLIVFAGRRELDRVRDIVKQLDVSGFGDMPKPRIIAIRAGKPSAVATTIREMYLNKGERTNGPRSVLVIGDDTSGSLIVRADDEKFAQIKALAETIEQQGEIGRVQPHVLRLKTIAAGRLRQTLLATFTETARAQGETLAIEVDRTNNALVIASSGRLLEEIQRVVAELDTPSNEPGVQAPGGINQNVTIVDVVNNDPAEIRRMLDEMGLTKPQAVDRPGVVSEAVQISVMSSRRALAIVGSPADGKAVESLVRTLDSAPVEAEQRIAVIPLRVATAKALATTLTGMLRPDDPAASVNKSGPAGALAEQIRRLQLVKNGLDQPKDAVDLTRPIRILGDDQTNTLTVASTQANIDAITEIVKLLDTLPVGDSVVMRIFPLENASATRVKAVVDQLFAQGEALRRLPGTQRRGLPPTATGQALAGDIAIAVDDRTNTMIAAGREEALALVEVLVKELDSDAASKWVEPVIIPLKYADATQLSVKLQEVLVRGAAATPEAMGLQRQFGRLRMVNQGRSFSAPEPQATLKPGVRDARPPAKPGEKDGVAAAQPGIIEADLFAPITGLVITAEGNMNALIVVGSPANLAVVKALVEQLDVEAASAANTVRLYPLQFAAADRVSAVLRDIFSQRRSAGQDRPEDALIISTDVRTNALVISSSAKSFAIVESLLKTLDGEKSNFSVGIHVLPVLGGDVRTLAPRIERLMRERIQAASAAGGVRNPLDAFTIEAEPSSNLLIVASSEENLQVVKELVKALTEDAERLTAGTRTDIIALTRARATEVAQSMEQVYVEKENQRRGPNSVRVSANERLNSVVATGTEEDLIELRGIARKLDSAEVAQSQQIKSVELKSASATEVVRLIESVLAGRPVGGSRGIGNRQATRLQFLRESLRHEWQGQFGNPPTEAEIDGAIRDQVTLTADARTNAVWITAPEPMVKLISEMIEDIERSSAGQRKIEKFRLVNADAARMRDLLRDIFNLRQQGDALVLVPASRRTDDRNADQPAGPEADAPAVTPVPDERQQLAIAVDLRTNTLVVSGTPEYLELVRKVVTELDAIDANDRERRVYHLRNAKAKDIETTLKSYFQGEADKARVTLGAERAGSLMKQLEEEVTVVGDQSSNKLVISTSPRYMESVLKIVEELDASPPQVMIQVLLAEVSIDASDQWGMDINVGPFGGEGYRVGSTAAGVGVATALGVPNLAVSSVDFSLLIRALEAQGKLEVLSNPQVLANNNQAAEIKVVDNIGVAGRSQFGSGSNSDSVISEVERIDAGIILKVTPSISTDGFVRMEIKPEISQLTGRTTQINSNQTSPIITKRNVDTVVTVRDGQSVVIGGLIQTTEERRESKVPILGDIPILGLPFRSKKNEANKTELLVILTPRVVPGQAGDTEGLVRDVTDQAVDRVEDPSKLQDYLERIRLEVEQTRKRQSQAAPTPAPTDQSASKGGQP